MQQECQPADAAVNTSFSEHSYSTTESPRKLKWRLDETTDRLDDTKRALKVQKQKGVRLRKKVDHLQTVIESLQDVGQLFRDGAGNIQRGAERADAANVESQVFNLITWCHVPGPEIEPATSGMLSGRANHYTYAIDYEWFDYDN